eukprot:SAG11_NODE_4628_length_1829_cov_1.118497_2_plen_471_part_01
MGATPNDFFGPEYSSDRSAKPLTAKCKAKRSKDNHTHKAGLVTTRLGWTGAEYDILNNNCCFFSNYFINILLRNSDDSPTGGSCCGSSKPLGLPTWVFSLARFGADVRDYATECANAIDQLSNIEDATMLSAYEGALDSMMDATFGTVFHHDECTVKEAKQMAKEVGVRTPTKDESPEAKQFWSEYCSDGKFDDGEDNEMVDLVKWRDYLDHSCKMDNTGLAKYLAQQGMHLDKRHVAWIFHCFDRDKSGFISGKAELDKVRNYAYQSTLNKPLAYYLAWALANSAAIVLASIAVNVANNYEPVASVNCDESGLTSIEGTLRALGALVLTESIVIYLLPVCGSTCPVPIPDEKEKDMDEDTLIEAEDQVPACARTGSIMFLKGGKEGIGMLYRGCGQELGFVCYFVQITVHLLQLSIFGLLIAASWALYSTSSCAGEDGKFVNEANGTLWNFAFVLVIVFWVYPLWLIFLR